MGRAPCCDKNGLKKGPWTPEEDQKLAEYIQKHGYGNWRTLPQNAGLQRCGKSCRLRWTNYLRPDIKRGRFSLEEEDTIIQLHSILGNKWSAIAARLPGRTDNEVKNYWNTHIRKRLLRMGIDPVTHSPRLDLLDLSSILSSNLYDPSQQINFSRFLGVQPLVNPELLRIASSLVSSHRENQSFSVQNGQENQLVGDEIQNQFQQQLVQANNDQFQELQNCTTLTSATTSCVPFSSNEPAQIMNPNEWGSNGLASNLCDQDYLPLQSYTSYNGSDHATILDHSPEATTASNWIGSNSNNFSFASVLSTPSSSPTPLNSNSTYINSSCSTEDEREISYCSNNMLKFEIPDFLGVTNFM